MPGVLDADPELLPQTEQQPGTGISWLTKEIVLAFLKKVEFYPNCCEQLVRNLLSLRACGGRNFFREALTTPIGAEDFYLKYPQPLLLIVLVSNGFKVTRGNRDSPALEEYVAESEETVIALVKEHLESLKSTVSDLEKSEEKNP